MDLNNMTLDDMKQYAKSIGFDSKLVDSIKIEFAVFRNPEIGGKYYALTNKIKLTPEGVLDVLVVYLHELAHAMQCQSMGKILYILAMAFCRHIVERHVDEFEDVMLRNVGNQKILRLKMERLKRRKNAL